MQETPQAIESIHYEPHLSPLITSPSFLLGKHPHPFRKERQACGKGGQEEALSAAKDDGYENADEEKSNHLER